MISNAVFLLTYDKNVIDRHFVMTNSKQNDFVVRFIYANIEIVIHFNVQLQIAQKSLRSFRILRDKITQTQYTNQKLFYINAIFIQITKKIRKHECNACTTTRTKKLNFASFSKCRKSDDYFRDCCDNCKFNDHAIRCSYIDELFFTSFSSLLSFFFFFFFFFFF